MTPLRDADVIRGYHAHVYFDASTRRAAETLREAIGARFDVELGRMLPHGRSAFTIAMASRLNPWAST
jgi:DOPA 4,5-dioxygenase